jgi:nitroreductase/NAD-dependent dihydropyrimidine dehydrogenase PreA subunit
MALITVDNAKCKQDGICAAVCPANIIQLENTDAFPAVAAGDEQFCIGCGHCVSVCPHGALVHAALKPEECLPLKKELLPGLEAAEQFLRSRRSIRVYKKEPVERATLSKVIKLAGHAPSGHNLQPVRWLVIRDSKDVQKLAAMVIDWMRYLIAEKSPMVAMMHLDRVVTAWEDGRDRICRSAPHVIVAHAEKENPTAPAACTIALSYLELAAGPFGLGTCWAGYFNAAASFWPAMQSALKLPKGHTNFGAMLIGYPKFSYRRIPPRQPPVISWR